VRRRSSSPVRPSEGARGKASFGARRAQPKVGAVDAGLRLLGRRAHSRVELRRKLSRRGYSSDDVDLALSRLIELGYLDDRSFAEGLVRRRGALRGPLALSAELAARGVDRAQADAAVAGFDVDAQLASATQLAERLYAKKPSVGYRAMLDGVGSKLLRRGFSTMIVRAACRTVLSGAAGEAQDLAPTPTV
jgi:regulatory protein